jgi:hypothetical protein
MQSDLIIDALLLAAVLEADLGSQRKIGKSRIVRPLLLAGVIIPLYMKAVITSGTGLTLEIALAAVGIVCGLIASALMTVYRSPKTGKPVSRTGVGYASLWIVVIGARAAFSYGALHWFSPQLGHWMARNAVTAAAITDALIFMAVAMLLTRTIGLAMRAAHIGGSETMAVETRRATEVSDVAA